MINSAQNSDYYFYLLHKNIGPILLQEFWCSLSNVELLFRNVLAFFICLVRLRLEKVKGNHLSECSLHHLFLNKGSIIFRFVKFKSIPWFSLLWYAEQMWPVNVLLRTLSIFLLNVFLLLLLEKNYLSKTDSWEKNAFQNCC